jgi:hypothetical protein
METAGEPSIVVVQMGSDVSRKVEGLLSILIFQSVLSFFFI